MADADLYDIGDVVRLTGTFSVDGVDTDPTTVTLKVKDPSKNVATYTYALAELTKSDTGIYYRDISLDEGGIWWYRWEGTGTVESAEEGKFGVSMSEF